MNRAELTPELDPCGGAARACSGHVVLRRAGLSPRHGSGGELWDGVLLPTEWGGHQGLSPCGGGFALLTLSPPNPSSRALASPAPPPNPICASCFAAVAVHRGAVGGVTPIPAAGGAVASPHSSPGGAGAVREGGYSWIRAGSHRAARLHGCHAAR